MSTAEKAAFAQLTSQSAPRTNQSSSAPSAIGGALQLKASLRGHDFATQVQMLAPENSAHTPDKVQAAAARGIGGSGGALPHGERIQRSFGGYDLSNVQTHSDAAANDATAAMGADAYATGNHVALGQGGQDLHTVAHEAAHVVQQRHGVALSGGVGKAGDPYEQHADAVADLVVQGKSAEGLLGQMAGGGGEHPNHDVQMRESKPSSETGGVGDFDCARYGRPEYASGSARDSGGSNQDAPTQRCIQRSGKASEDGEQHVQPPDAAAPLSPKDAQTAYGATRTLGWNPRWIAALQAALGVPSTGLATRELAQAVAAREFASGRPATGQVGGDNLPWLIGLFPALADTPREVDAESQGDANARGRPVGCPEDVGLGRAGIPMSYQDYASGMLQRSTFVGQPVVGHPAFLSRLKAAEGWLSSKKDGLQGTELANSLGIHQVVSFRRNTADSDQLLHGTGFAIDINQSANNWNFGNRARQGTFKSIMTNAGQLLGTTVIVDAKGLASAAKDRTTEEMFEVLSASNDALKRYRAFGRDSDALEQFLASESCPASAKARSAKDWLATIKRDERTLAVRTAKSEEGEPPTGFMDFDSATIAALRDAGGLRWGGTDFPGDVSGDMMHFDGYNTEPGKKIRNAIRSARDDAGEPFE